MSEAVVGRSRPGYGEAFSRGDAFPGRRVPGRRVSGATRFRGRRLSGPTPFRGRRLSGATRFRGRRVSGGDAFPGATRFRGDPLPLFTPRKEAAGWGRSSVLAGGRSPPSARAEFPQRRLQRRREESQLEEINSHSPHRRTVIKTNQYGERRQGTGTERERERVRE